eukprot:8322339-Prorocentrum_lima.AAC.1
MFGPKSQLEGEDFAQAYKCGGTAAFIIDVVRGEIVSLENEIFLIIVHIPRTTAIEVPCRTYGRIRACVHKAKPEVKIDPYIAVDEKYHTSLSVGGIDSWNNEARGVSYGPVSYTHLTLPTICSV